MSWRDEAACKGATHLFFPERGGDSALVAQQAKAICQGCPVRAECAEDGLFEFHGIWGGMSRDERQVARRGRERPPPPCGTPAAYRRHLRRGEDCWECREDNTARANRREPWGSYAS